MKHLLLFIISGLFISSGFAQIPDANGVLYVKKGGTGSQLGSSWNNAIAELGIALQSAAQANVTTPGYVKQIWVAAGTYNPMYQIDGGTTNFQLKAFTLAPNIKLYGHFAGTETSTAARVLTSSDNTILSGNLGSSVYTYHVVFATGSLGSDALVDGFTVQEGLANGAGNTTVNNVNIPNSYGGGIDLLNSAACNFSHMVITNNYALSYGGGIFAFNGSNIKIDSSEVSSNSAGNGGGVAGYSSSITVTNGTIKDNYASTVGGGIYAIQSSPLVITNSLVQTNSSSGSGGGIYTQSGSPVTATRLQVRGNSASAVGGGICVMSNGSVSKYNNVLLSGNYVSSAGGGIYTNNETSQFTNVTIAGNKAGGGGAMYNDNSSITTFNNSVIYSNNTGIQTASGSVSYQYSLVQGVSADAGTHVLDGSTNPLFTNDISYTTAATADGTYTLQAGSVLKNAGSNALYSGLSASTTDLAGNARVSNYANGGTIDIGAYELQLTAQSINAGNISKTYGAVDFAPGFTATSGLTVSYASADNTIAEAYQDAAAPYDWKITIKKAGSVQIIASQAGSTTYDGASDTFTLTIAKATLNITGKDSTRNYDGSTFYGGNGVSYTGFVNNEDSAQALTGTLTYGGSAQGVVNAGKYEMVPGGLVADNYAINFIKGNLTIKKIPLSITAKDSAKVYDGVAFSGGNGVSYAGFVNSEDSTAALTGLLTWSGTGQGAKNAGGYQLTPGGLNATNYTITYGNGTLTITQAPLSITASDSLKTYDGVAFSGNNGVSYTGFVNNEDSAAALTGTLAYGGTAQGAVNKGLYTFIPSGLTAINYSITYHNGSLTIAQASLVIKANAAAKTYDGAAFTGGNGVVYTGFAPGQNYTALSGTLTYSGTSQNAVNAGEYIITPGGYTATNYDISYVNDTLTINKAALTITAADSAKVYDGIAFNGGNGLSYAGFVNNEDSTAVLTGTVTYGGNSQGAVQANGYGIVPGGLSALNYDITYQNGTLTINKAALTITAKDSTKVYDGASFSNGNGVTYAGFVNGEDSTAALTGTLTYSGTSQGAANADVYTIIPGGLAADNYTLTYANGTLTINKAALTVTANDSTKVYDGITFSNGNGVTYAGFVNNEDSTAALTGTLAYTGTSQGAKAVNSYPIIPGGLQAANYSISYANGALTITKASLEIAAADTIKTYDGVAFTGGNGVVYTGFAAGEDATVLGGALTYSGTSQSAVNAGKYVIVPGGYTSGNYTITYVNDTLTINKAALTITAVDSAKVYDGIAFSGGNGLSYTGFVNNEDSTAALTGTVTYGGNAQGAVQVNGYGIVPGGLSALNYDITYQNGTLTINKAALTVTANDSTKVYDGTTFSNGNGVTYAGFVNNEDAAAALTGTLAYTGTSQGAKDVNTYTIVPNGLLADNYSITYVNGTLTIDKAALTVTAVDSVKTYDGQTFTNGNGVIYTGFVANEDAASALTGVVSYGGTSQGAVNYGEYTIIPSGLSAGNYSISYTNGKLTVNKAALMITANDTARCYGIANPVFRISYSGFVNNETKAVLTSDATAITTANTQSVAGAYTITASGAVAANYAISYTDGTLTVHALPVSTISASAGTVLCGPDAILPLTGSGNYTYEWSLNNAVISGETAAQLNATAIGTYTAKMTDVYGCVNNADNSITLTRLLKPTPAYSFDSYCAGTAVNFSNASDVSNSGTVTYTWYSGDGQTGTDVNAKFVYAAAGNYTSALTVTPAVCPSLAVTLTKVVPVEAPVAGQQLATVNTSAYLPTQLVTRSLTNASYTWLPGTGLSDAAIYNPVATLGETQEYTIRINFPSGCITIDTLLVNVFITNDVLVPNVFTPNGDGQNDLLMANLRGNVKLRYFRIFNRWGKKMFETSDAAQGWDGRVNGELQPLATYVWTAEAVDANGQTFHRQGSVTLIR